MQDAFGVEISKGVIQRTYYAAQASSANPDAGVRDNARFIYNARLKRVNRGNVSKAGIPTKLLPAAEKLIESRAFKRLQQSNMHNKITARRQKQMDKWLPTGQGMPIREGSEPAAFVGEKKLYKPGDFSKETAPPRETDKELQRQENLLYRKRQAALKLGEVAGLRIGQFTVANAKGEKGAQAYATVWPTGRIRPEGLVAEEGNNLAGPALLAHFNRKNKEIESPGMLLNAGIYADAPKAATGARVWRTKSLEARYMPGRGMGSSDKDIFYSRKKNAADVARKYRNKKDDGAVPINVRNFYSEREVVLPDGRHMTVQEYEKMHHMSRKKYARLENPHVDPNPSGKAKTGVYGRHLTEEEIKGLRAHSVKARLGLAQPKDMTYTAKVKNPETGVIERKKVPWNPVMQEYMSNMSWNGYVKGKTPFLTKTKRATVGASVAGAGYIGANRDSTPRKEWTENEHPRGYGGEFRVKGYKSSYKSVLDRQRKVSKSSEGTNQISSSIWSS